MTVTALDSSVVIDVLLDGSEFAEASAAALNVAREAGSLKICTVVLAEIAQTFPDAQDSLAFLHSMEIAVESVDAEVALATADLRRGPKLGSRILADHLIAAHGALAADRLLTRDAGFSKLDLFGLEVVTPSDLLAEIS